MLSLISLLTILMSPNTDVPQPIKAAVSDPGRPESDRVRDPYRKPGEVLAFFGIKPGDKVVDLMAGVGYYTDILCTLVGESGHVTMHHSPFVINRFAENLGPGGTVDQKLKKDRWANVTRLNSELDEPGLPSELDAAILILFYHDTYWQGVDRAKMNAAVFNTLKPGGIYGIVDHHAESGSGDRDVKTLHRVDVELVKKEIIAAGFVLDGESDLLAHPEDNRDYNVFRDYKTNRDHTDRFVLKFRKPMSP